MTLSERLDAWRERRELRREFARVTSDEIDDYGLSYGEFRALALMPTEQLARMDEMARINGLDPARLDRDRALRIAAALTCTRCREQGRCREALDGGALAPETGFCPNVETYRMLAAE
ncbi:hypothetical protein Rumeso_00388 [Rubellimicrobium mesophilum DSM 19309]|uniref:DUF6455 domain-containing protein n=1 Tax=Rubellimicrobium mesophilum DSM 19309 TaxID=442562 RepID=A0A017HUM3_9RHOB|nr:DUF6455 family protein [Rubellimicrobium mesophilum]EYD78051.1 hypothetical protein Rumeso_00388 [Rubellimicrobium mesophilum DSM 19309]